MSSRAVRFCCSTAGLWGFISCCLIVSLWQVLDYLHLIALRYHTSELNSSEPRPKIRAIRLHHFQNSFFSLRTDGEVQLHSSSNVVGRDTKGRAIKAEKGMISDASHERERKGVDVRVRLEDSKKMITGEGSVVGCCSWRVSEREVPVVSGGT